MFKVIVFNIVLLLLHPVHVTLTTIDQEQGSDSLKVFFRMFYDDFLLDYENYDPGFKPGETHGAIDIPRDRLNEYFNDRVHIYINNKLLKGELEEISKDDFEICLTLYCRSVSKPVKFRIVHEVLTGIYADQANMVYININQYQEAFKLTPEHNSEKCNLKQEKT